MLQAPADKMPEPTPAVAPPVFIPVMVPTTVQQPPSVPIQPVPAGPAVEAEIERRMTQPTVPPAPQPAAEPAAPAAPPAEPAAPPAPEPHVIVVQMPQPKVCQRMSLRLTLLVIPVTKCSPKFNRTALDENSCCVTQKNSNSPLFLALNHLIKNLKYLISCNCRLVIHAYMGRQLSP